MHDYFFRLSHHTLWFYTFPERKKITRKSQGAIKFESHVEFHHKGGLHTFSSQAGGAW